MTIQQLRILGYLAEYKSISKAADYCFLSQSALTRQLRSMEEELGYSLFTRHSTGIQLTPAGQAFHAATRKVVSDYENAVYMGRSACSSPVHTRLRIGVYHYSLSLISALCRHCEQQLPHITFDFISCRMMDSEKYLTGNLLDLCFPAEYHEDASGVAREKLLYTPNCCCIPEGHPLYGKAQLSLADLSGHSVLLLPAGRTANADRLREALTSKSPGVQIVDYNTPIEADALMLSKQYILMTLGLSGQKQGFSFAPLSDFPGVSLGAMYRQRDEAFLRPVLQAMREFICDTQHLGAFLTKL